MLLYESQLKSMVPKTVPLPKSHSRSYYRFRSASQGIDYITAYVAADDIDLCGITVKTSFSTICRI